MAKTTLQVETLIYKDVRGKELMYLKIQKTVLRWKPVEEKNAQGQPITVNKKQAQVEEVLINVGEKTYKSVQELIEMPTEEPKTQEELKAKVS